MNILQFLNNSYTAYHTTANVAEMLNEAGFLQLRLGEKWSLRKGKGYYVVGDHSSVVAFKVGAGKTFSVCESHTDSPSFKVKGQSSVASNGTVRLNTEAYGRAVYYSFFDRPLKVAGRLVAETDGATESILVASSYNVVIPSVAIHHNPGVNEGFSVNLQNDTLPLWSQTEADLYQTLTDKKVLDGDLYVVPATEAFPCGANNEFLCSPRLDNLTSVFCSVRALCNSTPANIAVCACLDNEEVGSGTRQGSAEFLNNVLMSVENALGFSFEEKVAARENGWVLSVDNGHAIHPAHAEKSDPKMFVKLNGGVVVKHHINYATNGATSAILKRLAQKADVPVQDYYNRSDVRCGGTLGLVTSRVLQMKTCDIGLAQLAMHSACETVGAQDIDRLERLLKAFFAE